MDYEHIYKSIRCPKCKHRLKEPFELKCTHTICRDCLSSIEFQFEIFFLFIKNQKVKLNNEFSTKKKICSRWMSLVTP